MGRVVLFLISVHLNMESHVIRQFTDEIMHDLAARFGINPANCKSLGGFENFVYEVVYKEKSAILRVTHGSHRNSSQIRAELDFTLHLRKDGLTTPAPFASENGLLVESTGDKKHDFHAVLFEKALGKQPEQAQFGPDLYWNWGRTMAMMHRSAQSYQANSSDRRDNWDEDDVLCQVAEYLPAGHDSHLRQMEEIMQRMQSWPTTPDVFGLIHADLHHHNFFWHAGQIIPFDFDDAAYNWFVYDIMVALFSSADFMLNEHSYQKHAEAFLPPFLQGYRSLHDLPREELDRIPDLLRLREILLVAVLHKKLGPDRFDARAMVMLDRNNARIQNEINAFDLPGGFW